MATIFTKIINREIPATIVFENDKVIAFKDINPAAPVHILVVPKKEIPTINDIKPEDKDIIGEMYLAIVRGSRFYQTLMLLPYAVAPAVAAVLWIFLFNPGRGLITHFLGELGYDWNHAQNSGQAMFLVVFASVWKQISYNFLFFFAALQSIPRSLVEAAAIDGAGPIRRFFKLALPLIAPVSFFLLVVNLVYAFFDTFPVIDAATAGGPVQATTTLIYKIYREGFAGLDLSASAAQSVVLMFLVIILTVVQFRYVESKVRYQ